MTRLIEEQPVAEVISWPERPRHTLAKESQLKASLVKHGVEHPITVVSREAYLKKLPRQTNSVQRCFSYVAISDYHWLEAARSLGWTRIPVLVRDMPQDSIAAFVLRRHRHNDYLGPLDEASLLHAALSAPGRTESQNAYARSLGWSPTTASQRLALLKLTPEKQAALSANDLSIVEARQMVSTRRSRKALASGTLSPLASG
ncbi:ParB/RepB/Spo0J family partition protein [Streptomyces sp. NPDC088846]|uniref:ParB/RepB/Spo0J family partition protein n=1 Tax=Streptomyces sp. NPDC088846 TaxID=3365908 RepID=UPI0038267902